MSPLMALDPFSEAPAWRAWFDAHGVARHDTVALPLPGDAASVAALRALLQRQQSLLLLRPPPGADGPGPLPPWCRFVLHAGPDGCTLQRGPGARAQDDTAWVVLATSGSTGRPRFAAFTHDALWANARGCVERLQLSPADRVIVPVPLAHMYGLGAAFLPATLAGAAVRVVPEANLIRYLEAEAAFEPTVTFLTPSFAHLLLKGRRRPRPYRLTVLAGDRASAALFAACEDRHGCTVSLYGSTELGVITAGAPGETFAARSASAGRPLPGVRVPAPGPEPFALRVEHAHGCAGYMGDDGRIQRPAPPFDGDGFLTQDLARRDADGRLQLLGRVDHSVKRDGMLVAFADVEQALSRLAGIDRVVVVAGGDTPRGTALVAFCTRSASDPVAALDITRALPQVLPPHARPDRLLFIDEMPLTDTAKPDRAALGRLAARPEDPDHAPPR